MLNVHSTLQTMLKLLYLMNLFFSTPVHLVKLFVYCNRTRYEKWNKTVTEKNSVICKSV